MKKTRDRISRPRNPADIRLAELRRQEQEDREWAARSGPVVVTKIDPNTTPNIKRANNGPEA